jgi:hypothetical protein
VSLNRIVKKTKEKANINDKDGAVKTLPSGPPEAGADQQNKP